MVMAGLSVNLTTLFRPNERLISTQCTFFREYLTTSLLESAEGRARPQKRLTRILWKVAYYTNKPIQPNYTTTLKKLTIVLVPSGKINIMLI